MKKLFAAAALLALALLLTSCAKENPASAPAAGEQRTLQPRIKLEKGLAVDSIHSIKAVVTGDNIDTAAPRIFWMAFTRADSTFSGTITVPRQGSSWRVTLYVYNARDSLLGQGSAHIGVSDAMVAITISTGWWQQVWNNPIDGYYTDCARANGKTYYAFTDASSPYKTTVTRYSGSAWDTLGLANFTPGGHYFMKLAMNNDTPYVAYDVWDSSVNSHLFVSKFDGASWVAVGDSVKGLGYALNFKISGNRPVAAFADGTRGNAVTVVSFNGSKWDTLGPAGLSTSSITYASYLALALHGDTPYVALIDPSDSYKVKVFRWENSSWALLGGAAVSSGTADYISMDIDTGGVYVGYSDYDLNRELTVRKFRGNQWSTVGTAGVTDWYAYDITVACYQGTPYVAFEDLALDGWPCSIMKFNGSEWVYAGAPGSIKGTTSDFKFLTGSTPLYFSYTYTGLEVTALR